jgi:phage/plasmid primase-like uncharacterized protein
MNDISVAEIVHLLALQIGALVLDLLPNGYREGHEWRCGSVFGEPGDSLGVHLTGAKAGIWLDFSSGQGGDALDLIMAVFALSKGEAVKWAKRWLGIERGGAALPKRALTSTPKASETSSDPDRWQYPWNKARPIRGTPAETYIEARGLHFDDPEGRMLRFAKRRARNNLEEYHPALLVALSDLRTGEQCGIINIYLQPDGRDRLRDKKGKTVTGRARGAVMLLSDFDEPTMGLTICEGVETGIAIFMREQRPIWACGGAGNLASFPVLGIEALTIAADTDEPGQKAAAAVAERWRRAGREVVIIAPPQGDWADRERAA